MTAARIGDYIILRRKNGKAYVQIWRGDEAEKRLPVPEWREVVVDEDVKTITFALNE